MKSNSQYFAFAVCLIGAIAFVGCNSVKKKSEVNPFDADANWIDPVTDDPEEEIEYGMPTSIGVIWVDSTLTHPMGPPVRGFGARVFFYDEEGKTVRTDGELKVYAFNDSGDGSSAKVPDRKFVFRQQEFQTHYAPSDLGPTYNFWIPWGPTEGPRLTVALLPIFETKDGRVIRGEQSLNVLPGKVMVDGVESGGKRTEVEQIGRSTTRIRRAPLNVPPGSSAYEARQVSHEQAAFTDGPLNQTRVEATTINVPPSLAYQMRRAQLSAQTQQTSEPVVPQQRPANRQPEMMMPIPINQSGTGQPNTMMLGASRPRPSNEVLDPRVPPASLQTPADSSSMMPQGISTSGMREPAPTRSLSPSGRAYGQPGPIRSYNHRR